MLPFKSLDAVTAPTTGLVRDLEGVACRFTIAWELNGAVHATQVSNPADLFLRGSLDGENWFSLGPTSIQLPLDPPGSTGVLVRTTGDNPWDVAGTGNAPVYAPYVRYVRADVDNLTAGTVSAWIVAADIQ